MNPKLVTLVVFRQLANLFALQGETARAALLTRLADAGESGLDIDEHLQAVADMKAETGAMASWDDINSRLDEQMARARGEEPT